MSDFPKREIYLSIPLKVENETVGVMEFSREVSAEEEMDRRSLRKLWNDHVANAEVKWKTPIMDKKRRSKMSKTAKVIGYSILIVDVVTAAISMAAHCYVLGTVDGAWAAPILYLLLRD